MTILNVNIKKLSPEAVIPTYAKSGDAGLDLTATTRWFDDAGNVCYGTGLAIEIPEGYYADLRPRSSISKYELAKADFSHNGSELVYTIAGVHNLEISSKGYIIDKGDKKFPKEANDTVYISARKGFKALNIAYKSLILLLNGYIPKGGFILLLKDDSLGYRPNNLRLVSKFNQQVEISFDTLERTGAEPVQTSKQDELLVDEDKTVIDPSNVYMKKATIVEYVTEDGKAFNTKEAAEEHQLKVTEAKEVAQVVLEYNKGLYGVAEKAYLRVMILQYGHEKAPYANFRDVMDNDKGVTERTAQEVVQFNKFKIGQEPMFAHLFSNKSYTQDKANEILDYLALAQDVFTTLKMLSTQTV